jgi:hypothetical protein
MLWCVIWERQTAAVTEEEKEFKIKETKIRTERKVRRMDAGDTLDGC